MLTRGAGGLFVLLFTLPVCFAQGSHFESHSQQQASPTSTVSNETTVGVVSTPLSPKTVEDVKDRFRAKDVHSQQLQKARSGRGSSRSLFRPQFNAVSTSQWPSGTMPGFELPNAVQTGLVPTSVATGDFNRDGNSDFAVASSFDDQIWVYLGRGDGTFDVPNIVPLTQGVSPIAIAALDLRGSGILDLIVANYDSESVGVFFGNGDGTFSYEHSYDAGGNPVMMAVGDFNGDGKKDLLLDFVNTTVSSFSTLLGDGAGGFSSPVFSSEVCCYQYPFELSVKDMDGDGRDEVGTAIVGMGGSALMKADDAGVFHVSAKVEANGVGPSPLGNATTGIALGDVNEDGCPDTATGYIFGFVTVRRGTCSANGLGYAVVNEPNMGDTIGQMLLADVNRDGHLDLITSGFYYPMLGNGDIAANLISIALGDGHGEFSTARVFRAAQEVSSLALADFNNDGWPDIVGVSQNLDAAIVVLSDGSGGFHGPQGMYIGYGPGGGAINAPLNAASFADVTGDGHPDMVMVDGVRWAGYPYTIAVNPNLGNGKFGQTIFSPIQGARNGDYKLGDFNGDGKLDVIAVANQYDYEDRHLAFAPGNGDGTFGTGNLVLSYDMAGTLGVGDFNKDGKLDFVVIGLNPDGSSLPYRVSTYLGNGDGTFRAGPVERFTATSTQATLVYVGDFNCDGNLDVIAFFQSDRNQVWQFLGDGTGRLTGRVLFNGFDPFAMQDVNHDGLLDIVRWGGMGDTGGPAKFKVSIYLGRPDGTFTYSSSYQPWDATGAEVPFTWSWTGDFNSSSFVADYNGDGNQDILVGLTTPENYGGWAWMQVLAGNGDGTFTPTYDIFDLRKLWGIPMYAADINGDGRAELIEVDGARSSMHVINSTPAPAVQLYLDKTRMDTDQGSGVVVVNVPGSSSVNVAMSASAGVNLPSVVTVPTGTASQSFTFTVGTAFNSKKALQVQAQLGSDVATAFATRVRDLDFSINVAPDTTQTFYAGESSEPILITAQMLPEYGGHLEFSCGHLPPTLHCTFTTTSADLPPGGRTESTLVVNSDRGQLGPLEFDIQVADGQVTHRKTVKFNLKELAIAAYGDLTMLAPGSASLSMYVSGINPIDLQCAGLRSDIACSFDTADFLNSKLTVTAVSSVPAGYYPFNIEAKSSKQTFSWPTQVRILPQPDFALELTYTPSWQRPTESPYVSVRAIANAGYGYGTSNKEVTVSCQSDAYECTAYHSILYTGSSIGATLTLSPKAGITPGLHPVTVTATDGTLSHSVSFTVPVVQFSSSASQSSVTLSAGGSTTFDLTAQSTEGFSGNVSLACNAPAGLTATLSPSTGTLSAGTPFKSTVTVSAASYAAAPRSPLNPFVYAVFVPGVLLVSFAGAQQSRKARIAWGAILGVLLIAAMANLVSCGGGGSSPGGVPATKPPSSYTVTFSLNTTRGGSTITVPLTAVNITVNH